MDSVRRKSTRRKPAAAAAAPLAAATPLAAADGVSLVHGIDVSLYQGDINWHQVVAQPTGQGQQIGFAFIKATEGSSIVDPHFAVNWRNSQGLLPRGPYHFFSTNVDPQLQAENFINAVRAALAAGSEQAPELPPVVDVEEVFPQGVTTGQVIPALQRILSLIEQAFGKRPIIYTGPSYWQTSMGNTNVFAQDYLLWIATYGAVNADQGFDPPRGDPVIPGGWTDFAIWQNAVQKGIAGIGGLVDRDVIRLPAGTTIAGFLDRGHAVLPDELKTTLVERAKTEERLQLTLDDSLFKQIVADGLAPNSPEFSIELKVQRAQRLDGDEVRVYFVQASGEGQPGFVTASSQSTQDALRDLLGAAAQAKLVLGFNKNAGLQRRIAADGYLPISGEFSLQFQGASYAAQSAQHPATGQKRVYFAQAPNWGYIQFLEY